MKKIISALQILVLCLSMSLCVYAAPENGYVIDDLNFLSLDEMDELDELGAEIYEERGIGVFFVFATEDEPEDYDVEWLIDGVEDYYIMVDNDDSWCTVYGGKGEEISLSTEAELREIYDVADTYVGGVRDFMQATAECFPVAEQAPVVDAPVATAPVTNNVQVDFGSADEVVLDDAELLSDAEEAQLKEKLFAISKQYSAQIVVGTLPSAEGMDIDELVNFFYDEGEFGYGANRDGVFLLVCMDPREYRILSNGFAGDAIQDGEIDSIGNAIVSDLSDGNYAAAFSTFADECAYYLDGHVNGFPFDMGGSLVMALVVGILVSFIVSSALKGQMKSVHKKNEADVYVKAGSMQITNRNEFFLYRDVIRTEKKEDDSKSRSSGSSRSVGGGKF